MDVSFAEHVHEERQHAAWLIVLESRLSWPFGLAGCSRDPLFGNAVVEFN